MAPKPYTLDKVAIRMVKEPPLYSETPVRSPDDAVRLMPEMLKGYDREVFCIPETVSEMTDDKAGRTSGSVRQAAGKESEKSSVLQDLTEKKADPKKPGHGRKKPVRTEEAR